MTLEELRESADVFAIEMLDIQGAHKTLHGEDVVAGIEVPMNLHRVEVEHDLRTTLLRLRNHLLLTNDGDEELKLVMAQVGDQCADAVSPRADRAGREPPAWQDPGAGACGRGVWVRWEAVAVGAGVAERWPAIDNVREPVSRLYERYSGGRAWAGCEGAEAAVAQALIVQPRQSSSFRSAPI